MIRRQPGFRRSTEISLLVIVFLVATLGFVLVSLAVQVQQGLDPLPAIAPALPAPMVIGVSFALLHLLLRVRRMSVEQVLLPVVALLFAIGIVMIWRLRGPEGVWQQVLRGFIPGMLVIAALVLRPRLVERMRRWAIPVSLIGLSMPIATALFGQIDETGARLSLKLGPLPPIQTSEIIKIALLIFLAWYIEREGQAAEGRARIVFGRLRLPALRYFAPGILFVAMATLALVQMSDFGAVFILGVIFVGMLYAGFETRIFATIAGIGLALALVVGLVLSATWEVPTVIRYRFIAFMDPWSTEVITRDGQSMGITISEGPGYQIQQGIYSIVAGGLTGTGLGLGSPDYIPLAATDFIYAAIIEELGAVTGIAILILYAVLLLRILRVAMLLPPAQVFERLLLIGIAIHFFTQVFVMAGGTLNLLPVTGVTIPFISQGGVALLVNLAEVGVVLAIAQRLGEQPA